LVFLGSQAQAQIGIGTNDPQAAIDVSSSNTGMLIPRVSLGSVTDDTTVTIPDAVGVRTSTLVFNDGNDGLQPAGFYYWNGTSWLNLATNEKKVFVGKFIINSSTDFAITGLPFKPKRIDFKAFANVDTYDLNSDNGVGNNDNTRQNYFGFMTGYANQTGTSIEQQVIQGGASARLIKDHSRYSSGIRCIAFRYANGNGNQLRLTSATLESFNDDGFSIEMNSYGADPVIVIYTAYKY